jgi:predicted enzyme related to lactoylglutathione lyase
MSSPIQNRIGMVFIPVSDIPRASEWYSWLFGLPLQATAHNGTIYTLPMQGEVGLILDGTPKPVSNSSQPLCFFWTTQIQQVAEWLKQHQVEIVREIEHIGSVQTLTFMDIDNNLLMVCQRNE